MQRNLCFLFLILSGGHWGVFKWASDNEPWARPGSYRVRRWQLSLLSHYPSSCSSPQVQHAVRRKRSSASTNITEKARVWLRPCFDLAMTITINHTASKKESPGILTGYRSEVQRHRIVNTTESGVEVVSGRYPSWRAPTTSRSSPMYCTDSRSFWRVPNWSKSDLHAMNRLIRAVSNYFHVYFNGNPLFYNSTFLPLLKQKEIKNTQYPSKRILIIYTSYMIIYTSYESFVWPLWKRLRSHLMVHG